MRSVLKLITLILILISLSGCKPGDLPLLAKDISETEDVDISYSIEQVILSKGYQSIEPAVEIVKKNNKIKLLASLGLLETSGVYVEKITKRGNNVSIYIHNETDPKTLQFAVPQIIIEIKNLKIKNPADIRFSIINENYKPVSIKLGQNEVVNKISAEFKVVTNTAPTISLQKEEDKIIWDVIYNGIFDRDNPETPLVNLSVRVDANTGEIIQSSKTFISSFIDDGHVLDYVTNKFILYKKIELAEQTNTSTESIWYFDIEANEKSLLYTSKSKVSSALFSPDNKFIALLEGDGINGDLYIIPKKDKKAYKVLFEESINANLIRWKDNNNIYIVESNEQISNIYNYNLKKNEILDKNSLNISMVNMKVYKDLFLIIEPHGNNANRRISYTNDLKDLRFLDFGFSAKFMDNDLIAYIKKNEKEDINALYIYNSNEKQEYDKIPLNISNYTVLENKNLLLVEKNKGNNDYTIYEYIYKEKELIKLTKVNSDNIYYNKEKELIYVDLVIPFESEKTEIIYSIDLSKLIITEP